ncbi:putative tetratricopeptide-like helical domain superfamily [Helianthus annuus]|nr:putative tetratricopeptide-like helical domain superfamily [Helianthus annuus]KAJ0591682.1 putative tetratricopeptide-like helical domain superfamily [Helianthus annuus]KAJ0766664.1 putative tetratricopeptide-like helical domain superfamily [Helianthus annuus]KAJ0772566.1 putative tetratricopeptide-like helical domain superfamily [Helianthus annuus]
MLLRSSSNPALNSWLQQQHNPILLSSPEPDFIHKNFRSPTLSLHSSNDSPKKISRSSSESDLVSFSVSKRRNSLSGASSLLSSVSVEEDVEAEEIESKGLLLFSSSGLDVDEVVVVDGGGGGGGDGSDGTDVYYMNMIETDPGNSLILANYAKYLKEVRGDVLKAEEYCSRAILANPNDGTALAMYAELIWETHKDASRARSYFDQAVKASPDDCYVMASYARFLWDADEEDEEEEEQQVSNLNLATHEFPIAPMAVASQG